MVKRTTFFQTRVELNKLLGLKLEPDFNKIGMNKSVLKLEDPKYTKFSRYSLNIQDFIFHSLPEELYFKHLYSLQALKLRRRILKKVKPPVKILNLNYHLKSKSFEFRKAREEQNFYRQFILNITLMVKFPFLGRTFLKKVPKIIKPLEYDPRLKRLRFQQPVFINFKNKIIKAHNGLRPKKKRKL